MAKFPLMFGVPDLHFPWESQRSLDLLIRRIETHKPSYVIQVGDLYDFFSFGRFPRTHNLLTSKQEIEGGERRARLFWHRVRQAAPRAKCFQLWGNHDERPYKQICARAPEFEEFLKRSVGSMMQFDGVETVDSYRDDLILKNVLWQHGYRLHGHHVIHNKMNTACGHLHVGGVVPYRLGDKTLFELNCGFMGNPFAVPLSYTMSRRFSRWTQGYGQWDEDGPRFVAFPNPKYNR